MNRIQNISSNKVKIRITSFWPAVVALIVITFLFCLPGNEFPRINFFNSIHFDKLVHVGLFSILVFLWILPPQSRVSDKQKINKLHVWIALTFVCYGVFIEIIQLNFVPNRSFDLFDILANTVGCAFGGIVAKTNSSI